MELQEIEALHWRVATLQAESNRNILTFEPYLNEELARGRAELFAFVIPQLIAAIRAGRRLSLVAVLCGVAVVFFGLGFAVARWFM